jgi:hypothetical protein
MAESLRLPPASKDGVMASDPKECRSRAQECTNLAEAALNKNSREGFLYFASVWLKLASQIESSEALVSKWGGRSRLDHLIQQQRSNVLALSR